MRIAIIGAGSIGSLVAGCLASTDCNLLLYGRGLHAAELLVNGLTLSGVKEGQIDGDRWDVIPSEHPLPSTVHSSCDVVIFTGKSSTDIEFLEVGGHLLKTDGIAFSLSNGMGFEEKMVHALGANRVLAATTTHGAYRPKPGHVEWAGKGNLVLGSFVHPYSFEDFKPLLSVLNKSGLAPLWVDDGRAALWDKMLLNIAINPVAAVIGKENSALLEPIIFDSVVAVMLEGVKIARMEGIQLANDEHLVDRLREVLVQTGSNYCSMLQDVRAGRATEIEILNAEICRRGERLGVATPLNQLMTSLIRQLR